MARPTERDMELGTLLKTVDRFAQAMKDKLTVKYDEGYCGWDDRRWPEGEIRDALLRHVEKGDMVDVANFAMFLWDRTDFTDGLSRSRNEIHEERARRHQMRESAYGRPVEIRAAGQRIKAMFHMWLPYLEDGLTDCPDLRALVETESGNLQLVDRPYLRFLDVPEPDSGEGAKP